jgi:hypothetical protein
MPARDIYHTSVRTALVKEGWTITHDPLRLQWGPKDMYVDLGAERILAAEKAGQQIAVEIKSFVGVSEMNNIEKALGQYFVYLAVLTRTEPNRTLYMAIEQDVLADIFQEPLGQILLEDYALRLLVFNSDTEVIVTWMPPL